jgi:uncharacterized protein (DUF3820 family)
MKLKTIIARREKNFRKQKLEQSQKVKDLASSWNPLPVRGQSQIRLSTTVDKHSNFINCKQRYMNVGKYKGIDIKDVPFWYIKWVLKNIQLNETELNLIRKRLKNKL